MHRRSQDLFKDQEEFSKPVSKSKSTSVRYTPQRKSIPPVRQRPTQSARSSRKSEDHCLTCPIPNTYPFTKPMKSQITISEEDSLLAQYGIHERIKKRIQLQLPYSACMKERAANIEKENYRRNWRYVIYTIVTMLITFISGFLGGYCYVFFGDYFGIAHVSLPPTTNTELALMSIDRLTEKDAMIHQMANSIIQLEEKLNSIKAEISNSKDTISATISKPRQGVLEELFTSEPNLASLGSMGSVLATPDTVDYTVSSQINLMGFLSFSLDLQHNPPQTTIKGLIQDVGDCWAFSGRRGRLVLALHRPSVVTGVSLSHIPATISPTGKIATAPRHFLLLSHNSPDDLENGLLLGDFEYNQEGPWRQTFRLNKVDEIITDIIEFRFLDNNGDPDYTCVYRVHVHGKII